MTSMAGLGYDGYTNSKDQMESIPAFGGWASYEHYLTKKLHANIVFGFTDYSLTDADSHLYDEVLFYKVMLYMIFTTEFLI